MTNAWRLYELTSGSKIDDRADFAEIAVPPPVPFTSIFSHSDGIVNWRFSVEATSTMAESIAVFASHFGLGMNPAVLYLVAERLAQPEGKWRHYDPQGPAKLFFKPHAGSTKK
jgi:hypothetical protein